MNSRVSQNFKKKLNFWILSCTLLCMYLKSNQKNFMSFQTFFQEWPTLFVLQRDLPKNTKETSESQIFTIYGENRIENLFKTT